MKHFTKNLLLAIGAAYCLFQAQELLGSNYIIKFLDNNLVSLLIALLAINAASLGIVLSKIRELLDTNNGNHDFSKTKNAMLFSIREQIVLIFLSLILLMINDSKWLTDYPIFAPLMKMFIITCFTYAMSVLYDSAKSIFIVLSFKR
jgi:hypothetical protein